MPSERKWMQDYMRGLVGAKIVSAGVASSGFPFFKLDDGSVIEVSMDPEGNGPGFLFNVPLPYRQSERKG